MCVIQFINGYEDRLPKIGFSLQNIKHSKKIICRYVHYIYYIIDYH